jgi:Copper transport outer membrane protein, MctB
MGYSSRYHAASLAAVFLALAIGILIGVNFGDDVVSGTAASLEESLQDDLADARAEADALTAELETERDFSEQAYPALVGGRLRGDRVGLVGIGGLPAEVVDDAEAMIEPTGATVAQVSVVRAPPDTEALAQQLEGTEFSRVDRDREQLEELSRLVGRQMVSADATATAPGIEDVREEFLVRESGGGQLDHVIVVHDVPGDLGGEEADATDSMEAGLLEGIAEAEQEAVGVERSDADESSIGLFDSHEISTSDSIDLVAGRVAAVFVLLGADGNFGTKESADQLLPDLLVPAGPDR